jgi:exopolysaccharide biosynthesis polyprenyl glycosylphosphotransferase
VTPAWRRWLRRDESRDWACARWGYVRLFVDAVALALAAVIAEESLNAHHGVASLMAGSLAILVGFGIAGEYGRNVRRPLVEDLKRLLLVPAVVLTSVAATRMLAGAHAGVGDDAISFWVASVGCLAGGRIALLTAPAASRRPDLRPRATLIVGAGEVGQLLAARLQTDRGPGLRPVGFLDDAPPARTATSVFERTPDLPLLGEIADLERVIAEHRIEQVVVAFSRARDRHIVDLVRRCWSLQVAVMVVPRLFEVQAARGDTHQLGGLPLLPLAPPKSRRWELRAKYALDRGVAAVAVVALAPVLAVITAAVRLTMGSPVLFRQERVGRDGRTFRMLKFRTMPASQDAGADADGAWASLIVGPDWPMSDARPVAREPRCTALGGFLRRTSLDELPQLLNVVRGDMSLVGPRPERVHFVALFGATVQRYSDRHRVKVGLTGWAQVHGLRGETSLHDRVEWDNFYIDNWSPWLDLRILCRTLPAIVRQPGFDYRRGQAAEPAALLPDQGLAITDRAAAVAPMHRWPEPTNDHAGC